jgi:medium-chain acyl-[acyl-carrier-protein] hydrolase
MTLACNSWVACARHNPAARVRLFCFPYAGGGGTIFRTWPDQLPATVEVCPIALPGREMRIGERPFDRLLPLAQAIADALDMYQDKPFAFFGHSMGALVSFEVARELRRQSRRAPAHLFVAGHRAPHLPDNRPPLHDLPEPAFVDEVRQLNGTPPEVFQHPELLELFLPILRADFAVCETYVYEAEPPLACPISVFGGLQDPRAGREQLEAWRAYTTAEFRLRMLPGDHFFVRIAEPALLSVLNQTLQTLAVVVE